MKCIPSALCSKGCMNYVLRNHPFTLKWSRVYLMHVIPQKKYHHLIVGCVIMYLHLSEVSPPYGEALAPPGEVPALHGKVPPPHGEVLASTSW